MAYGYQQEDPTKRMFDRLSKDPNVERGMHILQDNPNQDPVVQEMARTVLREVEKAKRRRKYKPLEYVIAIIIVIVTVVLIVVGIQQGWGRSRR